MPKPKDYLIRWQGRHPPCDVQSYHTHCLSLSLSLSLFICVNCCLAATQPGFQPIIPDLGVCARVETARRPRRGVYISYPSPVDPLGELRRARRPGLRSFTDPSPKLSKKWSKNNRYIDRNENTKINNLVKLSDVFSKNLGCTYYN